MKLHEEFITDFKNLWCLNKTFRRTLIVLVIFSLLTLSHRMTYDYHTYCCRHMARDIEDALETLGLDVKIESGYKINKSMTIRDENGTREGRMYKQGHMWISVYGYDIDSVWLVPLNLDAMYPHRHNVYDDWSEIPSYEQD